MNPFSRDSPGPAPRFRPGPGQTGEHAALQGLRPPAQHRPSSGRRQRAAQVHQGAPLGMGRPPEQETDNTHLMYGAMHQNAQALGRDLPFGLWALHNGYFPDMAPGKTPVDWLD
jgi:hypothetical protein